MRASFYVGGIAYVQIGDFDKAKVLEKVLLIGYHRGLRRTNALAI